MERQIRGCGIAGIMNQNGRKLILRILWFDEGESWIDR